MMTMIIVFNIILVALLGVLTVWVIVKNNNKKPEYNYDIKAAELKLSSTPTYMNYDSDIQPLLYEIKKNFNLRMEKFKKDFKDRTGKKEFYLTVSEANVIAKDVSDTVFKTISPEYIFTMGRYYSVAGLGKFVKDIVNDLVREEGSVINKTVYNPQVRESVKRANKKKEVQKMSKETLRQVADVTGMSPEEILKKAQSMDQVYNTFIHSLND